jgi:hypothetical protein
MLIYLAILPTKYFRRNILRPVPIILKPSVKAATISHPADCEQSANVSLYAVFSEIKNKFRHSAANGSVIPFAVSLDELNRCLSGPLFKYADEI